MIEISKDVFEKLRDKHDVAPIEVTQCFANGAGVYLIDTGEDHRTDPPTHGFISVTNRNRILKVCFVRRGADIQVKTAFEPGSDKHLSLYRELAGLPACWPQEE
ncbi:MAG TPA: DUF4258 domain-containing protein [Luteibacter sp.]|jgi:hypothetical protein|nr:DUF4258 domain-containing protein [Luteibacter sp.]